LTLQMVVCWCLDLLSTRSCELRGKSIRYVLVASCMSATFVLTPLWLSPSSIEITGCGTYYLIANVLIRSVRRVASFLLTHSILCTTFVALTGSVGTPRAAGVGSVEPCWCAKDGDLANQHVQLITNKIQVVAGRVRVGCAF
jgi:hypothetical protein